MLVSPPAGGVLAADTVTATASSPAFADPEDPVGLFLRHVERVCAVLLVFCHAAWCGWCLSLPLSSCRPQDGVIMSMQPRPWPGVPVLTAQVAGAAFPGGSLAIRVRDELGAWCPDEAFAGVYGVRGAPGISPAQLAVVTALQFAEDLTDRQAADAVRGRIDWKYCLGLELADAGFD